MVTKRLKGDFAIAYRPWRISEIYGQEEIKNVIGNGLDTNTVAHSFLFYGISGTGKTTIGRIIAMGLNCREKGPTSEPCCKCDLCRLTQNLNSFSFREFNSAHFRGIDHVREVVGNLNYASFDGADKTIIVFDECHRLTKDAQNLLLKGVEDSHEYNHFVFCSTQPEDIIKTLRNRCMPMEFKKVPYEEMFKLLCDVCECEGVESDPGVLDGIIKEADGMPRNALFLLQKMVTAGELKKIPELPEPIEKKIEKKMELVKSVFKGNSPEITIDINI